MAGSTVNPRIWVNADVYVAPVGTAGPTGVAAAWGAGWTALGLLSEDGMTEKNEQDQTDHYAYGAILVRTTKSKQKRTIKVTCLEDTPIVWGLVNPGSTAATATGITTRTVKVRNVPDPRAFGLQLVDGSIITRRIIPNAEVIEVGEVSMKDDEMAMYELMITIYPSAAGVLYTDITNDTQAVVV